MGYCTEPHSFVAPLLDQQVHVDTLPASRSLLRLGNREIFHMPMLGPGVAEMVLDTRRNRLETLTQAAGEEAVVGMMNRLSLVAG